MRTFNSFLIPILCFVISSIAEASLQCSQKGTTLVYVNDSGTTKPMVDKGLKALSLRYSDPIRMVNIDSKSNVLIDSLIMPTFGSTKDEIAALELKLKSIDSNDSLLNLLRAKKFSIGSIADYSNVTLPPSLGESVLSSFDLWNIFKLASDAITLNKAGEDMAKVLASKENIVKFFASNINEQAIYLKPKIAALEKNIYIAHGAGGYYLDAILDEIKKQDLESSTPQDLISKYEKNNTVLFLEHPDDSLYHTGYKKKSFINFRTPPFTHTLDSSTIPLNAVPGVSYFTDYNPFTDLYLKNVQAYPIGNRAGEKLVSEILDDSIYDVAQGLEDNCAIDITICNGGYPYDNMTFDIESVGSFDLEHTVIANGSSYTTICECKKISGEKGQNLTVHVDAVELPIEPGQILTPIDSYDGIITIPQYSSTLKQYFTTADGGYVGTEHHFRVIQGEAYGHTCSSYVYK